MRKKFESTWVEDAVQSELVHMAERGEYVRLVVLHDHAASTSDVGELGMTAAGEYFSVRDYVGMPVFVFCAEDVISIDQPTHHHALSTHADQALTIVLKPGDYRYRA